MDGEGLSKSSIVKLAVVGGLAVVMILAFVILFDVEVVTGHEVGVMETWNDGVKPEPYSPKTYFLFINEKMFKYDTSTQVFVMNDLASQPEDAKKGHTKDVTKGREKDAYLVQSAEGQDMHISLNVQWRMDPTKVVALHKTVRYDIEEKLLRPVVMRVVKDQATKRTAIEAYSGLGLVALQNDIQKVLMDDKNELKDRGVIVDNFVIEGIRLDPKYISEITEKQVAIQRKLKADEQTKAAEAEALRAKAEAQADLQKQVVAAERDKQVGILTAEKSARQAVLAAEADKSKVVLQAEAEKEKLETYLPQ
jgi:regulator of protease activity HflC (stomatin/prohibitin superfamily)